jgi:ubiquinone biosynthesis protein
MTTVLYTIVAIPLFIAWAWMARRLLGVRRLSALKTITAGILGLAGGDIIGRVLFDRGLSRDFAILVGVVLGLIFTMIAIITFEALSDPTRAKRRKRGLPHPVRATRRLVDQGRRSIEITRIASRYDLGKGFGLGRGKAMTGEEAAAYGTDLAAAFDEAGGVYVKLGQILATRPDLIPAETAQELGKLHQDVEPVPRDEIQPALEAALGRSVDDVFADFDWAPVGAGSIGQVYRARLVSGEPVIVKVRRPDIDTIIERDLGMALDLVALIDEHSEQAQSLGVAGIADQFVAQLRAEMDYRVEARNTIEAAAALSNQDVIVVPLVFDDLSSESVLVLQTIEGEILGRHGIVGGDAGRRFADALFRAEVDAMLTGERFNADPHPGNIILVPDGGLGLIDFGSAGRLDTFERSAVTDILTALALNDPTMLRAAALQIGMGASEVDPAQLDRAFARLMADHLGSGAEPTAELLQDFLEIANQFGLRMPPTVSEMLRALATLQGSLEMLSPGYPLIEAAKTVAMDQMKAELKPDNLAEELKRETIRLAPILRRAPHHLDRIAGQIEQGRLTVRVSMFSDENDVRLLSRLVNRAVLAFVGAALGVVSAMLFALDTEPLITDNITLFDLLGFVGMFAGAVLIMRVVLEILNER